MLCWTGSLKQWVERKSYLSSDLVLEQQWKIWEILGWFLFVLVLGKGRDESCVSCWLWASAVHHFWWLP